MHICLPDTREVRPTNGSAYLLYNVHIDGLYHCSLRYKQLLHLHQTLTKALVGSTSSQLPQFPPKKLLPLSSNQVEERRLQLEKYLQNISQDKSISRSPLFNLFLLEAQRESTRIREDQVHLDIELVNGQKIRLQIVTHDSADDILTAACRALGLNDRYHAYFCLCLCGYDVVRDKLIIKRRFSFFESPYITLQMAIQQQEQIQNVLATTNHNNNNNSFTSCRYCTCTSNTHLPKQQHANSSITTGVPHLGSSGGSIQETNQNHPNQQNVNSSLQSVNHQNNIDIDQNCLKNQHQELLNPDQALLNNTTSSASRSTCCYHNGHHQTLISRISSSFNASSSSTTRNFVTHRILLRKSYWDPVYDTYILGDQQALNLLFIQTVYDMKHSLMFVDRKTYHQLESLLASDSKLEYILLARTLKYYNYVHFEPCLSDYPRPRTKVMISIGSKELNMRVLKSPISLTSPSSSSSTLTTLASSTSSSSIESNDKQNGVNSNHNNEHILYCTSSLVPSGYHHLITRDNLIEEEYNFKVPLIRCWRLTSLETLNSNSPGTTSTTSTTRRKSLSLFGSNSSNMNGNITNGIHGCAHNANACLSAGQTRNLINTGYGGNSLITALSSPNSATESGFTSEERSTTRNTGKQHNFRQEGCSCNLARCLDHNLFSQYELSFEYLISKDTLRWITISSDQAIFISISLQGVVEELVSGRSIGIPPPVGSVNPTSTANGTATKINGSANSVPVDPPLIQPRSRARGIEPQPDPLLHLTHPNNCSDQNQSFSYMYRDGSQKSLSTGNQHLMEKFAICNSSSTARQRPILRTSSSTGSGLLSTISNNNGNSNGRDGSNGRGTYSSLPSSGSNFNGLRYLPVGGSFVSRAQHPAIFEISNFKKAPSPIINDAFEGVANDDDL